MKKTTRKKTVKAQAKLPSTHISVVLDRSGSMETLRNDTIGGFNTFLDTQKKVPGQATLTLVQFDGQDPYEVIHHFKPISLVPELTRETFVPRGNTPLLDAIGRAINDIESSVSKMNEASRPDKVMMVIITDGQENASREFKKDKIKEMIDEKSSKMKWEFLFLSSDLNAVNDAQSYGVASTNTLCFAASAQGTADMYEAMNVRTMCYRGTPDIEKLKTKTAGGKA